MNISFNFTEVQKSPTLKIHYAEIKSLSPKSPLIILLHGFGEYWYAWNEIMPELARKGFHVVAPDLRGFHLSDRPNLIKDYEMKFLINDIKKLIENLGAEKAIIIGHDWGGAITWELADTYPELCHLIIVLNCPHRGAYAKNIKKDLFVNLKQSLRSWYIYFFQIPILPELALKFGHFNWAEYNFRGWAINKKAFSDERIEKYKAALALPGALTAQLNYYRANILGDYGKDIIRAVLGLKKFNKIRVPAMLIWAENDIALEKSLTFGMDEFFEKKIEVKYIPNCSHWVHIEQPKEVILLIENFLLEYGFYKEDKIQ